MLHYALAGTLTQDHSPEGYTLGGTTFYGGTQARRLGARVSVISAARPDLDLSALESGIHCYLTPSAQNTTFQNIYDSTGQRVQYVSGQADALRVADAPPIQPDILHLCPLLDDVPLDYGRAYPEAKIALTPQGWMRRLDADGRVHSRRWDEAGELLPQAWAMVFSEEDVNGDEAEIERLGALCPIAVCTRNFSAASLFVGGRRFQIPAYPAQVLDPTGAGDVFAAAFFVWLHESQDPEAAARVAHLAAGRSIEGRGTSSVLARAELLALYQGLDLS